MCVRTCYFATKEVDDNRDRGQRERELSFRLRGD